MKFIKIHQLQKTLGVPRKTITDRLDRLKICYSDGVSTDDLPIYFKEEISFREKEVQKHLGIINEIERWKEGK